MTRIAPTLTLLAVAALGGGMFVANAINDPAATQAAAPAPAAVAAPTPAGVEVLDLAQLPVVGAPAPAPARAGVEEIDLAQLPVVGAPAPPAAPAVVPVAGPGERTEISLADIPVVGAPAAGGAAPAARPGEQTAFAGRTSDRTMTVAVAVQDGRASGYVCGKGIEAWLTGTAEGGTLSLKSTSGRTVLTGTEGASGLDGTVTIDGTDSAYTAEKTDVATAAANGRTDVGKVAARLGSAG
jgi:hypothetical protein